MRCPNCGEEYVEGIRQCSDCGAKLQDERLMGTSYATRSGAYCPRCGQHVRVPLLAMAIFRDGGRYSFDCQSCGLRLMPSKRMQWAHTVGVSLSSLAVVHLTKQWWDLPGLRFFPLLLVILALSVAGGWLAGRMFLSLEQTTYGVTPDDAHEEDA